MEEEDRDDIAPLDGMEGDKDVDLCALSDMELSPSGSACPPPAIAVDTQTGLVDMDGPTLAVFRHFIDRQGA
jgi:hypothetical protein